LSYNKLSIILEMKIMTSRLPENILMRKTRWLTQALILSGTLNIGLLTTFIYFVLQERHESLAIELKPVKEHSRSSSHLTNADLLKAYSQLPYQELLIRLENQELIEEGLHKRDLALTCLVAFHHFNLDKALCGLALQKRSIYFANAEGQEKIELPVYPGLMDDQYQAIMQYAKTEKWPFTSQGLFYELKRSPHPQDPSLIEAFCLSPEYEAAQTLFSKSGFPLSCTFLINLLSEGEWKTLSDFTLSQRQALDLSLERRRHFILSYLNQHSKSAARLLLETDLEFTLKRCDDGHILTLLDLYEEKSIYLENFAKGLLASPRTDIVWKRAAAVLYALAGETMPEPYEHRIVLQRFFPIAKEESPPAITVKETPSSNSSSKKKIYTIESGDNLWKIARKFHVSIDEIKRVNHLETEKLRPGKQLEIPTNTHAEK
jgi:hypothetical protein